jgi:hypothetical protein
MDASLGALAGSTPLPHAANLAGGRLARFATRPRDGIQIT